MTKYIPTIGVDFGVTQVQIDETDVKISFYDLAGDLLYNSVAFTLVSALATRLHYTRNKMSWVACTWIPNDMWSFAFVKRLITTIGKLNRCSIWDRFSVDVPGSLIRARKAETPHIHGDFVLWRVHRAFSRSVKSNEMQLQYKFRI